MHVGMMDPGPGEDGDITMRLRLYGYKIGFALRSVAYTDVPVHMYNLIMQRKRWERDALWIRFRKHVRMFDPKSRDFKPSELPHLFDYFITDIFSVLQDLSPHRSARRLWPELHAVPPLPLLSRLPRPRHVHVRCACLATGKRQYWRLWPFMLIYGPWKGYFMRRAALHLHEEGSTRPPAATISRRRRSTTDPLEVGPSTGRCVKLYQCRHKLTQRQRGLRQRRLRSVVYDQGDPQENKTRQPEEPGSRGGQTFARRLYLYSVVGLFTLIGALRRPLVLP